MTQAVIDTEALVKRFDDDEVLRGIDLTIQQGQVVGLLGTNGSGKTTLIKCWLGLLKSTAGGSRIFGDDSWNLSAGVKARLGYVSQDVSLLPWMKVEAICDYFGAFYQKWDKAYVRRLVDEWELPPHKRTGTLSVGQRQKLSVILAMGHHPELLILDEPVASLDPVARRQFLQSLIEFTENEENTIVFSTHITSDLERVASHVAMLRKGRVGFFGELDALKSGVKRLRIRTEHPLPGDFAVPGALRCEVHGNYALAAVHDLTTETVPMLSSRWGADVDVEDLNLEEIFLELSGVATNAESEVVR